ncbi:hypothetical protein [Macrococcoides canis]|uniref:hypothetical protein n=1 Tax=Macrococcoides canis TaxID=1855823 RepID=UPI00106239C2|nr:hypothetical protein [Macrococcus canis]TDM23783.1 hypothetical protein ETI02_05125 [Macrococcus canis]
MRKTVKTGRGTGKTIETIQLMKENKNLYTIVPNHILKYDLFRDICIDLGFSKEITDDIIKRVITIHDIDNVKYAYPNARFHIEEADWILRDLLKIDFDTMTTSHWYVETFRRNKYEGDLIWSKENDE